MHPSTILITVLKSIVVRNSCSLLRMPMLQMVDKSLRERHMSMDKCPRMIKMSKENVQELSDEELSLKPFESKRSKDKKKRRIQAIMGMIAKDSHVSLEAMANQLDVSTKTVWRDISELKEQGVLERIGDDFNGEWSILKKKK